MGAQRSPRADFRANRLQERVQIVVRGDDGRVPFLIWKHLLDGTGAALKRVVQEPIPERVQDFLDIIFQRLLRQRPSLFPLRSRGFTGPCRCLGLSGPQDGVQESAAAENPLVCLLRLLFPQRLAEAGLDSLSGFPRDAPKDWIGLQQPAIRLGLRRDALHGAPNDLVQRVDRLRPEERENGRQRIGRGARRRNVHGRIRVLQQVLEEVLMRRGISLKSAHAIQIPASHALCKQGLPPSLRDLRQVGLMLVGRVFVPMCLGRGVTAALLGRSRGVEEHGVVQGPLRGHPHGVRGARQQRVDDLRQAAQIEEHLQRPSYLRERLHLQAALQQSSGAQARLPRPLEDLISGRLDHVDVGQHRVAKRAFQGAQGRRCVHERMDGR
mmetsp:Transcript_7413/g.28108  ORF Transcript_7413/g.28108 Transcript_7413/m.28108 type:complete len:382 (-) Transcript_7413:21-1166(-)